MDVRCNVPIPTSEILDHHTTYRGRVSQKELLSVTRAVRDWLCVFILSPRGEGIADLHLVCCVCMAV